MREAETGTEKPESVDPEPVLDPGLNPAAEKRKGRPAAPLGKTMRFAFRELWQADRGKLFTIMLLSLVKAFLPGLQVYATGMLVNAVVAAHASGQTTLSYLAWPLGLFGGAFLASYALENLIKFFSDLLTLQLSYRTDLQAVGQLSTLEVQDFEQAQTYDTIQRVDSSTGEHIFGLFDTIRSFLQSSLSVFSIVLVVGAWNPYIALMLLVAPIPGAIATFRIQVKAYDIEYKRAPESRLASYYRGTLS